MSEVEEKISIEVAMVTKQAQKVIELLVPSQSSIGHVIILSGIAKYFPEVDWSLLGSTQLAVGVFGQKKSMEYLVQVGDRIEIYLPLEQSALDARKQRVADKKALVNKA